MVNIPGNTVAVTDKPPSTDYYRFLSEMARYINVDAQSPVDVLQFIDPQYHADIASDALTVDVAAAVQAALDSFPATGGTLYFPRGSYKFSTGITVPSRTTIYGERYGTKLVFYDSLDGGFDANEACIQNGTAGDDKITIHDLVIDTRNVTHGGHKAVMFFDTLQTAVYNCSFLINGQGIAHVDSAYYLIFGNHFRCFDDLGDAVIDQWYNSHNGIIVGNHINCDEIGEIGILITSLETDLSAANSFDYIIADNYITECTNVGINLQGGGDASAGTITGVVISNNVINNVTEYYGMWITGRVSGCVIEGNIIKNTRYSGIRFSAEAYSAGPTRNTIIGNTITQANVVEASGHDGAAITFGTNGSPNDPGGTYNTIAYNTVLGTVHTYALSFLDNGSDYNRVWGNSFLAGTSGTLLNAGTENRIDITQSFTPEFTLATPSDSTFTENVQEGEFEWLGGDSFRVRVSIGTSAFAVNSGSGNLRITGFPFTFGSGHGLPIQNINLGFTWPTGTSYPIVTANGGQSYFEVFGMGSGISRANFTHAHIAGGVIALAFSGIIEVA